MQTGIGKITSKSGNGGFSKDDGRKRNCSKVALFTLIFIFSCATFQKPDQKSLKKNLEKICFSAEGRGRVGLSSKKYGFDFESLISRDKKKWSLDFHFPGGMERIIDVDYERPLSKQKASFKKLLVDLNQEEFNDWLLGEFWEKMSKILKAQEELNPDLNWSVLNERFLISLPAEKGYFFRFEASELDSFYKRIKILIESDNRGLRDPPLEIDLYLDNCSVV